MFRKVLAMVSVAAACVAMGAGCAVQQNAHTFEGGYSDAGKLQVQFFAPEGSTVTVGSTILGITTRDRSHQVGTGGDRQHKLEMTPEETATFNLGSGTYEFKYQPAGWPEATVYGEVQVVGVCPLGNPAAAKFVQRCFVPVALPSPEGVKQVSAADDRFPYQGSAYRLKISYQDIERLASGDLLTKVVFVADLKKAKERVDCLEVKLSKLAAERQRRVAMLNEKKMDWVENPKSDDFVDAQAKITKLDQDIRDAEQTKARLESLLRADKVLTRSEMLVMATDEILPTHEDPVAAANDLGQVILVIRIGGRHMHWQ